MLIFPRLSSRSSISHTIRMYDMPTMRIRRDWPGESRLGRLAMDLASSVSVPLSAVPPEISRLVLESLIAPVASRNSTVRRSQVSSPTEPEKSTLRGRNTIGQTPYVYASSNRRMRKPCGVYGGNSANRQQPNSCAGFTNRHTCYRLVTGRPFSAPNSRVRPASGPPWFLMSASRPAKEHAVAFA